MFINNLSKAVALGLGFIGASSAFAASSVDFGVTGTISPGACTVSSDQSTLDLGSIFAAELGDSAAQVGPTTTFTITTECDSPMRSYIKFVDNRPGSANPDALAIVNSVQTEIDGVFGLGLHNGNPIGMYLINSSTTGAGTGGGVGDGVRMGLVNSNDGGATWTQNGDGLVGNAAELRRGGLRAVNNGTWDGVGAYTTTSHRYQFRAFLPPKDKLSVTEDIKIDGGFTVEMYML